MNMLDLYPAGTRLKLGDVTFTDEDIIRFARQFDPQPFHTDAEAAKSFVFGGLCASGWHTCANWMKSFIRFWSAEMQRLQAEGSETPRIGPSPGFNDLQWLKPVFAGDTISYWMTPIESRRMPGAKGYMMVTALCEGFNQNGEPVLRFHSNIIDLTPQTEKTS
ncbi:MaoC family dehydratase [Peteryoungia desertarenae]|uniref:MaoC family dehydratase n=1 Tax=Peteryoungia desertarenae TaxID=1813451 RepID=A0ABX6QQT3_9HYPH|nr:MaoC family dehydratase [Peteryoungia desertarenae]QLF70973.1 MaoC family dehydratase [Peteryoungia desertarenae]